MQDQEVGVGLVGSSQKNKGAGQMKRVGEGADPSLDQLLEDAEVKEFFRFIHDHDMRLAALEALKSKLSHRH